MKLYEIDRKIADIFESMTIDEVTGEVILDTEALAALQEERSKKLEGAALMVRNLETEAKAIKAEEDRLAARRKAFENKAKRIREWLGFSLGGEKLKTAMVTVSTIKPKQTAKVDNVDQIITWWYDTLRGTEEGEEVFQILNVRHPAPTVSTAGLKQLLDDGYEIPGCHIDPGRYSATIR